MISKNSVYLKSLFVMFEISQRIFFSSINFWKKLFKLFFTNSYRFLLILRIPTRVSIYIECIFRFFMFCERLWLPWKISGGFLANFNDFAWLWIVFCVNSNDFKISPWLPDFLQIFLFMFRSCSVLLNWISSGRWLSFFLASGRFGLIFV